MSWRAQSHTHLRAPGATAFDPAGLPTLEGELAATALLLPEVGDEGRATPTCLSDISGSAGVEDGMGDKLEKSCAPLLPPFWRRRPAKNSH